MSPLSWPRVAWHWYAVRATWGMWAFAGLFGLVTSVLPWRAASAVLVVPWVVVMAMSGVVRHLHYKSCASEITGPLNALPETHVLALLAMLADPDVPEEWKPALEAAEPDLARLAHLHADVREIVTRESGKRREKRHARVRRVYGTVRRG